MARSFRGQHVCQRAGVGQRWRSRAPRDDPPQRAWSQRPRAGGGGRGRKRHVPVPMETAAHDGYRPRRRERASGPRLAGGAGGPLWPGGSRGSPLREGGERCGGTVRTGGQLAAGARYGREGAARGPAPLAGGSRCRPPDDRRCAPVRARAAGGWVGRRGRGPGPAARDDGDGSVPVSRAPSPPAAPRSGPSCRSRGSRCRPCGPRPRSSPPWYGG